MADDIDFNEVLDTIVLAEESERKESYKEGYKAGSESGNPEGYHLGYHRGAELGRELEAMLMENKVSKLRNHIDSVIKYLKPFLPLANCHMVEFITDNHWENLLPSSLRKYLDSCELDDAVKQFWDIYTNIKCVPESNELSKWINNARMQHVSPDNEYCLTVEQFEKRITSWGGELKPEVKVSQFMTSKKSYEVQRMSRLVAALASSRDCSHVVEVGGGRAPLPAALSLAYRLRVLTVDCNEAAISTARQRMKLIQKQWHAIAKRLIGEVEQCSSRPDADLNRFVCAYVTAGTDLRALVRESFGENRADNVKLLLTGLHTCGNLGPDSLRLFTQHRHNCALFNTPCCYHLLTERVDANMCDVFHRDYCQSDTVAHGFPMSEHLRGYNLGRNARMLAAQSVDRVVRQRQLPSRSLLYRAMLQMVIKEKSPKRNVTEGRLKGLADKCQDFRQYFKMADAVMQLDMYDSLSDSYFEQIQQTEGCQWKKIVLFYLARLCLAQVVESIVLLDRLMFLFENGFQNACLVKLFNPVLSPRCHSIVAVR